MSFDSVEFLLFFCCVYGVYVTLSHRWQNRLLLVASYFFYGTWNWRFIPLLLFATWICYSFGLKIASTNDRGKKLRYLRATLVLELGLLGVFKYFNFFADSVADGLRFWGASVGRLPFRLILPLGISYYTFQAVAYSVDVYRGKCTPSRDFVEFAVFKSFFPILFGGPIERAKNLLAQVQSVRRIEVADLKEGAFLVAWGLFKKLYISDGIAPIVDRLFAPGSPHGAVETCIAAYGFAFQIYCDFSGYTDIARGLARLMGFRLVLNFDLPYLAANPVDFWRRWHISLSSWFTDYFYEPFFFWTKRIYLSLFSTFFLIAIWHGASWNFVLLGVYNGAVMCGYVLIRPYVRRLTPQSDSVWARRSAAALSVLLMFNVTSVGFIFFRAQSVSHAAALVGSLFVGPYRVTRPLLDDALHVGFLLIPLVAMEALQARSRDPLAFLKLSPTTRFACALALAQLFLLTYLFGRGVTATGQFIYFQF